MEAGLILYKFGVGSLSACGLWVVVCLFAVSVNADEFSKPILLRFQTRWHNQLTSQGDLVLASDSYRDQPRNIEHCLLKLRQLLASVWVAPKVRKPTKPTKASKERRLKAKKQRSEHKKTRQKVDW